MSDLKNTILLVDDHPLFRKGLSQLINIEPDLEVVGECSNGQEAIERAVELKPDLIVIDLNMQGMDGLETIRVMKTRGIQAKLVTLTVSDSGSDVVTSISNGSDGYLLKDMEPEVIIDQIKLVLSGKFAIADRLAGSLAEALRKPEAKEANPLDSLTSRERDILKGIAQGKMNKQIARDFDISEGTVKVHVKHILKKMNFRSRIDAAIWVTNNK